MRPIVIIILLTLCLSGCTGPRTSARGDLAIISNDYGFPSHGSGNPYSADEIGGANEYIDERIDFHKARHLLTAYLVPTAYSNRLVFVPTRFDDEPSTELLTKIAKDVKGFLDAIIRTRPWNKKNNQPPARP